MALLPILALIACSAAIGLKPAEAQSIQGLTIHPDGTVTPQTAPIRIEGNLYTLTADLYAPINVQRVGITIDGANHTLRGPGKEQNVIAITLTAWNVTVRYVHVVGWRAGIYGAFDNNTITNCSFENNSKSISLYGGSYIVKENTLATSWTAVFIKGDGNLVAQNKISSNQWAFDILQGTNNTITRNNVTSNDAILVIATYTGYNVLYGNNFLNNKQPIYIPFGGPTLLGVASISAGQWDNGYIGNYWGDYSARYPNATETNKTGIWNTAYTMEHSVTGTTTYANGTQKTQAVILGSAVDNFPLLTPFSTTSAPDPQPSTSLQTTTPTVSSSATVTASPSLTPSSSASIPAATPSIPEFQAWIIPALLTTMAGALFLAKKNRTRLNNKPPF